VRHWHRRQNLWLKPNHQFAQLAVRQLGAAIAFVQNAFQLWVFGLDGGQGIVDALADIRLLGSGTQGFPRAASGTQKFGGSVVVAVFQFGSKVFFAGIRVEWYSSAGSAKRSRKSACRPAKVSEKLLKEISPSTGACYSAASILARSLSAAAP